LHISYSANNCQPVTNVTRLRKMSTSVELKELFKQFFVDVT